MKFPTFVHWKHFFKILSRKEKTAFFGFLFLAAAALAILIFSVWQKRTVAAPADGGSYAEAVIGQPRFLNPVYSDSNIADRDIVQLLFAGLLEYDKNGQIAPGLANYKISEDGKTYDFTIKDGLKWSDGQPITSDDAIYTIKIIQDQDYKSPLRPQWLGVEIEKVSETSFRLKLKDAYSAFLESCTLKIIPRHIWEKTDFNSFPLSELNLNPVGSGHYRIKKINLAKNGGIDSIQLEINPNFYGKKPHLTQIDFVFFEDYNNLAAAFKRGRIQGFVPDETNILNETPAGTIAYDYLIPRYFAIFFNPKTNEIFADAQVRLALTRAVNKDEILQTALKNKAVAADSPIPYDIYGIVRPNDSYDYDLEAAKQILEESGYKSENGQIRTKIIKRQPTFQFTKTLLKGSALTSEVKELQKCLAREIMPDLEANGNFGEKTLEAVKKFQEKYRQEILDPQNIKEPTGEVKAATRDKLNALCFPSGNATNRLEIDLTIANQEPFVAIAQLIKKQWEAAGIAVNVNAVDLTDIERDIVKPRNYQTIIFGQALGMIPDPYLFWHSSQIADPGLNFSLYENKNADKILEEIRFLSDAAQRTAKIEELQNIIVKDQPAIFLYNPKFVHVVFKSVKGIAGGIIADPAKRFAGIADWHINTKRIWK